MYNDFQIIQKEKTLSLSGSNKIVINKYENKISRLLFTFDGTIEGRLYVALLNPVTKKYFMIPVLNNKVIITTDITVYPGRWDMILIGIQDDYEITDNDIDQSKLTYISDTFRRVVIRDNFLNEENIERVNNPAIDESLEALRIAQDRLEDAAIKAVENADLAVASKETSNDILSQINTVYADITSTYEDIVEQYNKIVSDFEFISNNTQTVVDLVNQVSAHLSHIDEIYADIQTIETELLSVKTDVDNSVLQAQSASASALESKNQIEEMKTSLESLEENVVSQADEAKASEIAAKNAQNIAEQSNADTKAVIDTFNNTVDDKVNEVNNAGDTKINTMNQIVEEVQNNKSAVEQMQLQVSSDKSDVASMKSSVESTATQSITNIEEKKSEVITAIEEYGAVRVSADEPTSEHVDLWIDNTSEEEYSIPEIKDDEINATDTWSSQKMKSELDKLQENMPSGSDGKSAYEYAQEGGYTGTEAEFAQKLAVEYPTDVQINGTSIVGEDGVAAIPLAYGVSGGYEKIGVVRASGYNWGSNFRGIGIDDNGYVFVNNAIETMHYAANYRNGSSYYAGISTSNIDYAVKRSMTDGIGTAWTDTEKTGAWTRLTTIKTTMDEVAVAGARYYLGELTELSVVLPDDALVGQKVDVSWYNGDTPSTLSITGNMLDFDFTPAANTRSEISCLWDGRLWSVIGLSQDLPSTEETV